jgi:hypothetical protein
MTKLTLDTIGGLVSEQGTFGQLVEHLRLAAEAAYVLGHHRKANGDDLIGSGFLGIGQLLERCVTQVTKLATAGKLN